MKKNSQKPLRTIFKIIFKVYNPTGVTPYYGSTNFKVPSSEIDPAEIRFIQKDLIKERGLEDF